ncbi:hypothetical protein niasHT_039449 [Heterodera trifolii]|uniref:Uncharacterized protein n=1 Tax=Heterodera trifolii TaxID=157864 RepID=A0ABD2II29_9BILA
MIVALLLCCGFWFTVCRGYCPAATKAKTSISFSTTNTITSTPNLSYCAQQCGPVVQGYVYRDCSGIPFELVGQPTIGKPYVNYKTGCAYIDIACKVKDIGFPVQVQFNNEIEVTKTEPPLNNLTVTLTCTNDPANGQPRWTKLVWTNTLTKLCTWRRSVVIETVPLNLRSPKQLPITQRQQCYAKEKLNHET